MSNSVGSTAWIGLGANLGDGPANLRAALKAIAALPDTQLLQQSKIYRTAPIDAGGPDYANAVACVRTTLSPEQLLKELQAIELRSGRKRPFPNAPRTIDLDLLMVGEEIRHEPNLILPHPRMHQRAFVLVPLLELDPELRIPGRGLADACLSSLGDQGVSLWSPEAWSSERL